MLTLYRKKVYEANLALEKAGLIALTWGNASAIDPQKKWLLIKPSGVPYEELCPENMVLVDPNSGAVIEGDNKPSTDLATHIRLYQQWPDLGGIVHTHAKYSVAFAQAQLPIPCFGTTHADYFDGDIPLTRPLSKSEVNKNYEKSTGDVIIETFAKNTLNYKSTPGVLVSEHGPFTWGSSVEKACLHAIALEEIAKMASLSLLLNPQTLKLSAHLMKKHYLRKHGPASYYGQ